MVDLKEFVTACVDRAGGLADLRGGLVEVLVPEPLEAAFPRREVVRLALDPEAAGSFPDAEPALPGSRALDALIEFASRQGRLTHAFPRVGPVRPRGIAGEILRAVTFTARRVRLPEEFASVEAATMAQFDFIVSLISDERDESLQSVVVDLWTGAVSARLTQICHSLDVGPHGTPAGRRACVPTTEALRTAQAGVEARLAPLVARHQALIARRLQAEHGRLTLYYDGLVEDLERRIRRAEGNAGRQEDLRQKVAATRAERASKLAELNDKYRLRPVARLAAIRLLHYPRLFSRVGLDRKHASREVELCWDPLLGRLQLPLCDGCRREASRLELTLDGRIRCPECAA